MQGDFDIGGCSVHVRINRISRGGKEIRIRPRSMRVLVALARSDGVVTKNELVDSVWHGADVSQDVLTQSIVELRKAMGDEARDPRIIETIHRVGYRLLVKPVPIGTPAESGDRHGGLLVVFVLVLAGAVSGVGYWLSEAEPPNARTGSFTGLPQRLISKEDAKRQYLLGRHFMQNRLGSWLSDARNAFESAIAIDPGSAETHAALAASYLLFEETPRSYSEFDTDLEAAKRLVQRALEIQPDSAEALLVRARIARLEIDAGGEERDLRAALAADPGLVDAHVALAEHLAARLRIDEALQSYTDAGAIDPNDPQIAIGMANVAASRGDYEGAISRLMSALEEAPSPAVYSALVTLSAEYGDYVRRLRWAIAWVRLTPRSATAAAELGDAYTELGASEFALAWLRHARQISGQAAFKAEMRHLVVEQQYQAMLDLSRPFLPPADELEMSPDQSAPTALAGLTLILLGQYETGARFLERATHLSPTLTGRAFYQRLYGRNALITAYRLAGESDAAARVIAESREIERQAQAVGLTRHPQTLRELARLSSLDGNGRKAIELLEAAVEMGWRSVVVEGPHETDQIYWRTVANDRRYQLLMQHVREHVAKMRSEAAAAGLLLTPIQIHESI